MVALSKLERRRELARKQNKQIDERSGRRERTTKPTPGRSKWRILPATNDPDDINIGHSWGQHFVRNSADELVAIHMCLDATYGKSCPICESLVDAIRVSDDKAQKVLTQAKAQNRFLVNALHLDGDDPTTPVLLDLTSTTYQKLTDLINEWGSEEFGEVDIVDPVSGHDITINRTGKGIGTKYDLSVSPVERKVDESVLKKLHDLDDYVNQINVETQAKAIGAFTRIVGFPSIGGVDALGHDDNDDMGDVLEGEVIEEKPVRRTEKQKPVEEVDDIADDEIDDILGDLEELEL